MSYIGTYDGTIYHNPANKYCVIRVKSSDTGIPEGYRSPIRKKDHLIRFTAVGYSLPLTDAIQMELDGECMLHNARKWSRKRKTAYRVIWHPA